MPTPSLWEYTAGRLIDELRGVHRQEGPDVYIVTVFLGAVPADDPRETTLAVLWNTEVHYALRADRASAIEAADLRWGTEFMLRGANEIWHAEHDPDGHAALARWAAKEGLTFHDDPDADEDDLTDEELQLHNEMVSGLVGVMRGCTPASKTAARGGARRGRARRTGHADPARLPRAVPGMEPADQPVPREHLEPGAEQRIKRRSCCSRG